MFSRLVFSVENQEVIFDAYELINIAQEIVDLIRAELGEQEVPIPNYRDIDTILDNQFWHFTRMLATALETSYQLPSGEIFSFLEYAHGICTKAPSQIFSIVTAPINNQLLNTIKTKEKTNCFDMQIDRHVIIPMQFIQANTMKQWMFIAKYLANNYLNTEFLSGWWFKIGGRVIRLRNDIEDGELRAENKQFYASDHDSEEAILTNTKVSIQRSLNNFTWNDNGSYFRAFQFWQYFIQAELEKYKTEFSERVTDEILKDDEKCRNLFLSLGHATVAQPAPLPLPAHLSREEYNKREQIYRNTFFRALRNRYAEMLKSQEVWIKTYFITHFKNEFEKSHDACDELLQRSFYLYSRPDVLIPYAKLPEHVRRVRDRKFNQVLNDFIQRHQNCIRAEFIASMNDEIASSPNRCQSLLMSLAHFDSSQSGVAIDEAGWDNIANWNLGSRELLQQPEINQYRLQTLTNDQREQYGRIFDELIEQFRYVTHGILKKRVQLMQTALNPFYTQIRNIMHPDVSTNYIMTHILLELAKAINHGEHEPLFREVSAYGDRVSGDSYQKFEKIVTNYFAKPGALSEAQLAAKMREMLEGKSIDDPRLSFLPCLTAAWFISESARNSLTTMTSLMLLDMIESGIQLNTDDGDNWYCWRNVLIHPKKGTSGRTQDLYGRSTNIDEFGGCHPMIHQGSVKQTETLPMSEQLTIARQKEGSLIIHWLAITIGTMKGYWKGGYNLQNVKAEKFKDRTPVPKSSIADLLVEKEKKEHKIKKETDTIRIKTKNDANSDVSKQKTNLDKLTNDLADLDKNIVALKRVNEIKQEIRNKLIKPLLKLRLADFRNLLKNYNSSAATYNTLIRSNQMKEKIGPRHIAGWELQDVPDQGNCFYDAITHQMQIIHHEFLTQVPVGTLPRDSLRLRIQGQNFQDGEWADFNEIMKVTQQFNVAIAIADTRAPQGGFVYYHTNANGEFLHTNDRNQIPVDRQIIRVAYTGNHYLSVIATAEEKLNAAVIFNPSFN